MGAKLSIYEYESPVHFLNQYVKSLEISFTEWAAQMQIPVKPLSEILKSKRKLKLRHIDFLCKGIELSEREWHFFKCLVRLSNAENEHEREFLEEVKSEELKNYAPLQKQLLPKTEMKHWLAFALLDLPFLRDFDFSKENLQKTFREEVDADDLWEVVQGLIEEGMIHIDSRGKLSRNRSFVTTKNDQPISEIHRYYEKVSELAKSAVKYNLDEREFQCFNIPVSFKKVQRYKELMREFRRRLESESDFEGDELYQVNLQMFPLTEVRKTQVKTC